MTFIETISVLILMSISGLFGFWLRKKIEAACLDYDYADDDSIRVLLEDTALEITRRVK